MKKFTLIFIFMFAIPCAITSVDKIDFAGQIDELKQSKEDARSKNFESEFKTIVAASKERDRLNLERWLLACQEVDAINERESIENLKRIQEENDQLVKRSENWTKEVHDTNNFIGSMVAFYFSVVLWVFKNS